MMPGRPLRASVLVVAVVAVCSVTLRATFSAYTASVTTASNAFAGAPDWVAPTAATEAIGRNTAYDTGFIEQGGSYYVYANVSDTGNPASGIATVTANVSSITPSGTVVALTAGTYSAGGTAYGYRSAIETAATTLSAGSKSYTITSTDKAANAGTQTFTTVVDNTQPTAIDVQSSNVARRHRGPRRQGRHIDAHLQRSDRPLLGTPRLDRRHNQRPGRIGRRGRHDQATTSRSITPTPRRASSTSYRWATSIFLPVTSPQAPTSPTDSPARPCPRR